MMSEKTAKVLGEFLVRGCTAPPAVDVAAFLGVELAPERPALPEWAEREWRVSCGVLMTACGQRIDLDYHSPGAEENRSIMAEIHRRWLAAKRKLEVREKARGWSPGVDWRIAAQQALALLRGEEA
jgi:hypothetical protein